MPETRSDVTASEKKFSTSVILVGIFGILGIHHFYLGRWLMGAFDLGLTLLVIFFYFTDNYMIAFLLFIIDLIHSVIVMYFLLVGQYRDGNGHIVTYPGQKL